MAPGSASADPKNSTSSSIQPPSTKSPTTARDLFYEILDNNTRVISSPPPTALMSNDTPPRMPSGLSQNMPKQANVNNPFRGSGAGISILPGIRHTPLSNTRAAPARPPQVSGYPSLDDEPLPPRQPIPSLLSAHWDSRKKEASDITGAPVFQNVPSSAYNGPNNSNPSLPNMHRPKTPVHSMSPYVPGPYPPGSGSFQLPFQERPTYGSIDVNYYTPAPLGFANASSGRAATRSTGPNPIQIYSPTALPIAVQRDPQSLFAEFQRLEIAVTDGHDTINRLHADNWKLEREAVQDGNKIMELEKKIEAMKKMTGAQREALPSETNSAHAEIERVKKETREGEEVLHETYGRLFRGITAFGKPGGGAAYPSMQMILPDVPIFTGETLGEMAFEDWFESMKKKMFIDWEWYPSPWCKMGYVVSRLKGKAAELILGQAREGKEFKDWEGMIKVLRKEFGSGSGIEAGSQGVGSED